jgi:hypothetical protein
VTITRTTNPSAERMLGRTVIGLAAACLVLTGAAAPFAVHVSRTDAAGRGAGAVAGCALVVFAYMIAGLTWSRITTTRRQARVRPLVASAVALAVAAALAVQLIGQTVAGNAHAAGLGLGYVLFASIVAGALYGIACLPVATPASSR